MPYPLAAINFTASMDADGNWMFVALGFYGLPDFGDSQAQYNIPYDVDTKKTLTEILDEIKAEAVKK